MADLIASTSGPSVDVRVHLPRNLPPAKVDPNQLEMALLNLAVNARHAMPNGGVLTISAVREAVRADDRSKLRLGDYVRLTVSDIGVGMDEATLARAVEPFFSTKGIGKGTGLGLSMVHGLALQLGGAMTIRSRVGEGTVVDPWLPVSVVAIDKETENAGTDAPVRSGLGTALLVDDEDLVRMSTADMLVGLGYDVVEAASGEQAVRLLDEGLKPDLLVTDHLMPGMNGRDLAQILQAGIRRRGCSSFQATLKPRRSRPTCPGLPSRSAARNSRRAFRRWRRCQDSCWGRCGAEPRSDR